MQVTCAGKFMVLGAPQIGYTVFYTTVHANLFWLEWTKNQLSQDLLISRKTKEL